MKRDNATILFIVLLTLAVTLAVMVNVFLVAVEKVHIRSGTDLTSYIESVSTKTEKVIAERGNIYDANGEIVAKEEETYNIICYLSKSRKGIGNEIAYVDDVEYTSHALSEILGMEYDTVYKLLNQSNLYQTELGVKGRNLSKETKEKIESDEKLHGIDFVSSSKRVYSKGSAFAPYLIGFAQANDEGKLVGKMGLELYLNEELSGTDGLRTYQSSKDGYTLPGMYENYDEEVNGYDVYTTIDVNIEEALEESFEKIVVENDASKAWGAVVEINTGKILAWGQTPSFDPNVLDIEDYLNTGSQFAYEPGSVFKSIIYAAAMDLGVYDDNALFDSSTYCYSSNGNTPYRTYSDDNFGCITNAASKSWGNIDFDHGLIYSSNVATMTLLEKYVGTKNFIDYVYNFGFFKEVDTDGIEEVKGVKNYFYPSEKLSLTYGQGSSVTMLQLLQAYTAIFGNGEMLKPYYIDRIVNPDTNETVYQAERTVVSTPIKETTARKLQALLERVVSDPAGTAQYYAVEETDIMAKTGTSEISLIGEGYNSENSISSIMLAYPADNPRYMIYYAYVSPYNYLNHLNSTVIKEFISNVVRLTESEEKSEEEIHEFTSFVMPNLLGSSLDEAMDMLNNSSKQTLIIGSGDTVVKQYPLVNENIYEDTLIFILTNGNNISVPDFTGYTRKDLLNWSDLTNIEIEIEGYGVVVSQSMNPYSIVTSDDKIKVTMDSIRK